MKKDKEIQQTSEQFDVKYIWKQGFPSSYDHAQALTDAENGARLSGSIEPEWNVVSSDIIETEAHIEAGEFLVSLTFGVDKADV